VSIRAGELHQAVVRAVVTARLSLGWSQRRLAQAAGVSQSFISRFERGETVAVTLDAVTRLFRALGIRANLQTELPVVHGDRRQVDAVHAWACGYVGRRLSTLGWDVRHEVEVGTGRFRGWIDVLGYRPNDRSLLINECKTDIVDVGAVQRSTSWYEREAWRPLAASDGDRFAPSWRCCCSTAPRSKRDSAPIGSCSSPRFPVEPPSWRHGSRAQGLAHQAIAWH
jgi:transcriptional regulator with XRE-family HTH domain